MLDVYQVQGIVKQSQAESRQKFEQDHPDIVEFLAGKIVAEAKKGNTELILETKDISTDSVSIYDIEKYLNFKGFYTDICATTVRGSTMNYTVNDDKIEIKWPKG